MPTHLKAGFLFVDIWVFSMRPIDYSTFAISYNLRIFVLRALSLIASSSVIWRAASSSEITAFHPTKRWINYWQKLPRDLTFLYLGCLLPCWHMARSSSSEGTSTSVCFGSFKLEESKFKLKNVGLSKFEFLSRLNLLSAAQACCDESYYSFS